MHPKTSIFFEICQEISRKPFYCFQLEVEVLSLQPSNWQQSQDTNSSSSSWWHHPTNFKKTKPGRIWLIFGWRSQGCKLDWEVGQNISVGDQANIPCQEKMGRPINLPGVVHYPKVFFLKKAEIFTAFHASFENTHVQSYIPCHCICRRDQIDKQTLVSLPTPKSN